jgi:hypothetical protein
MSKYKKETNLNGISKNLKDEIYLEILYKKTLRGIIEDYLRVKDINIRLINEVDIGLPFPLRVKDKDLEALVIKIEKLILTKIDE